MQMAKGDFTGATAALAVRQWGPPRCRCMQCKGYEGTCPKANMFNEEKGILLNFTRSLVVCDEAGRKPASSIKLYGEKRSFFLHRFPKLNVIFPA